MSNATMGKLSNKLTRHLQSTWPGCRFVCRFSASSSSLPAVASLVTAPEETAIKAQVEKFLQAHGITEAQQSRIRYIRLESWGNI